MNFGQELQSYIDKGIYPFHMPGHKRSLMPDPSLPYGRDVTEVEGTDDLHHATGFIKEAMERAAGVWGAERSCFLVNGSTCGNLAGITAMVPYGSEVICQRNSHLSVFHALELWGLQVHWIYPKTVLKKSTAGTGQAADGADHTDPKGENKDNADPIDAGICGSVDPEEVRKLLIKYPRTQGVILTSPSYEGVLSDIETICRICHSHREADGSTRPVPVFVDEAHGAHLGPFYPGQGDAAPVHSGRDRDPAAAGAVIQRTEGEETGFPKGALACGADIVVQSLHKTLPSLTQTAILHLQGDLADPETVEEKLSVFETSSPSYLLMEAIDTCVEWLEREGLDALQTWMEHLTDFRKQAAGLKHFRLYDGTGVFSYDPGKLLFFCGKNAPTGVELEGCLRERFKIQAEMSGPDRILFMTGPGDKKEAYEKLFQALHTLDLEISGRVKAAETSSMDPEPEAKGSKKTAFAADPFLSLGSTFAEGSPRTIAETLHGPKCACPMEQCAGKVLAEYIFCYPPGIPLLVPGEQIPADFSERIFRLESAGAEVRRRFPDRILCAKGQ